MPQRFEFFLRLSRPRSEVFRILTDGESWRGSRVYGEMRWVQGRPWEVDSVREVETLAPVRARHTQRVAAFEQDRLIEVISHGFGYTNYVQLLFTDAIASGGTEFHVVSDIEGTLPLLFGFVLEDYVARFMEVYLAEVKRLCEPPSAATSP